VLTKHFQTFKGKELCGKCKEFKFVDLTGEAKEAIFHGNIERDANIKGTRGIH